VLVSDAGANQLVLLTYANGTWSRTPYSLAGYGSGAGAVVLGALTPNGGLDPVVILSTTNVVLTPLTAPTGAAGPFAPRLSNFTLPERAEGQVVPLSVSFTDPDGAGTYTATVAWGDGSSGPATVSFSNGVGTITSSHAYADNGRYVVRVTLSDLTSLTDVQVAEQVITNVAPTLTAGTIAPVDAGVAVTLTVATFTDAGFTTADFSGRETFTAVINWGDGSPTPFGRLTLTNGGSGSLTNGTITGEHTFAQPGTYQVQVTVTDDDGGTAAVTIPVVVRAPLTTEAKLAGMVWADSDGNGQRNGSETGLANVVVTLTGTAVDGTPVSVSTTTDGSGFYKIEGLPAGTYRVVSATPSGYRTGVERVGSAGGDPAGAGIGTIVLAASSSADGYDFGWVPLYAPPGAGLTPPPTVTGITRDTGSSSTDGITGDPTLIIRGSAPPNTIVTITRTGTGVIGTTVTDRFGHWQFDYTQTVLPPGSYGFTASVPQVSPFGIAGDFNYFLFENATQTSNSVGGRIAAGGNLTFSSYSVGSALPPTTPPRDQVIAGGNVNFSNGTVSNGNVVYGGTGNVAPNGSIPQETARSALWASLAANRAVLFLAA
jgi:hypothetical protein